jgi:hypothetical protein
MLTCRSRKVVQSNVRPANKKNKNTTLQDTVLSGHDVGTLFSSAEKIIYKQP